MKRLVLLACVVAGITTWCWPQSDSVPRLTLRAEILRQAYCPLAGDFFSVRVSLRLHFTNQSQANVILPRHFDEPLIFRAAKDADAFGRGEYEFNPTFDVYHVKRPGALRWGKAPEDNKFVILAPGKSYETIAQDSFAAARSDTPGFVASGEHVLQVGVQTWPMKFEPSKAEELAKRWQRYGTLQSGTLFAELITFTIPRNVDVQRCTKN